MTIEKYIEKIFKENDVWYEVDYSTNNEIMIFVEYGDWKHDHLFIDYLMEKNGFLKTDEVLTWEDGSDCYSSVHHYKKATLKELKELGAKFKIEK